MVLQRFKITCTKHKKSIKFQIFSTETLIMLKIEDIINILLSLLSSLLSQDGEKKVYVSLIAEQSGKQGSN